MKIAIYTHSMEMGGAQLNAIEIGEEIQSLGHSVVLVAEDGRLVSLAETAGLERIAVSRRRGRPSMPVMAMLSSVVRERKIDVVHGYEWPPVLDAWFGPHMFRGTPVVATIYSAAVAPFLPRSIPLIVGVESLRRQCYADGFGVVELIEPPVNTRTNSPTFDGRAFRAQYEVQASTVLVVVVCRLARELKLEGLLSACRVVGKLASQGVDIQLAIVGDGPVRSLIEEEAARANASVSKRRTVLLTGPMDDPRPAYAAADIMLGMGGSALRGLAFAKPLIVQGEAGFWKLCDEGSVSYFLENGWYGLGNDEDGDLALEAALAPLLQSPSMRAALGQFGRDLVVGRFSLEHAAKIQLATYERATTTVCPTSFLEFARVLHGVTRHNLRRRWERLWNVAAVDDFNAIKEQRKAQARATV